MKTNVWKRGLSLLLAMVLVLGFLPMNLTASAEEATGNLGQADGIIWLEKVVDSNGNTDASSAFYGKIFSLDDMIREALGITDNSVVVRYEGVNLGDPMELITNQGKAEQLKDRLKAAISNHELMAVTVGGEEKLIAFRNVASAQISVGEDNIIYVDHPGAPDDIEAVVKNALDSMQVTVELSGTVTAPAKDHKADVEVGEVMDSNGEVDYDFLTWPVGGKMEIGTVELSVYADEYDDGHEFTDRQKSTTTATVVLRDSLCTLEYKGVILDENGYVVKEISLGKFTQYIGEEPQIPEDDYYQIVGWQTAPPAKVEGSGVYTAILSAEKYTVTFLVEDGAVYDTVTDYRGTELLVSDPTSGNPSLRFNVWKPDVNGDGELDAEELKGNYVPEIEGNITYIATWTEGPSVVLYLKDRDVTVQYAHKPEVYSNGSAWTAETPAVEDLLLTEEDKANGYQIVWYYEGGSEDVNCDDIYSETQFVSDVTALPDTDAVALYMEKIRLLDGEEYAVGTVKNPAYIFNYLTSGGNLYYSVELTQSEYLQNKKPVEPEYNDVPADKVFTGWEYSDAVPNADESVYTITVTLKPFEELKNTIELGTPDAFIYEEFYTCSVEPEGNRLVVVFKDKVTGVEYKGYVTIADMGRTYDAATKIMVTPLWKYENGVKTNEMGFYVNNLLIGKDQNAREVARWNNYNAYKDASDVALMAINSADSKLYIDYQLVELGQNLATMNAGQEYSEEDIFGNLVSGMLPYNNGEDVTVQYWSEGEENVTVDLYKLYELLDANGVGILKSMIEEQVGTSATYDLPGQWININNLPDAELTAQEAVDTLCGKSYQNLEDARFSNEALGQFAADVFAMEQTVKETAIHKFGYNDLKGALANAVNEKLRITYQNEKVYATRDYEITLTDNRAAVSFAAISDITTPYNSGVEDKILDKVILTNSNGETVAWSKDDVVTVIDGVARDFSVAGSGTYKDVQVFFKGNAQYMPAFSEKFDVTVTKINPGVDVVDLIAEIHGDKYFDKAGVTVIPDAPVVQIIAGVAVDELKFDKDLTIKDDKIVVDAWVKLPETYTNLLDNFELENLNGVLDGVTLPDKTIHIGAYYEIEHLEDELQAYVDKGGAGAGLMEELLNIVDQIPERVVNRLGLNDLSYTLRVRIDPLENKVYPTEPGFYVNFAATVSRVMQIAAKAQGKEYVDPNYGVAEDVGFIVLSPMIPIPNRGGIQLYDGEVSNAQNKFEYEYNGTPVVRDLEVALNGVKLEDAEPFYYGISTRFKQVKEAPSKPGVYFAGYNYTKEVLNEDTGEMEVRRLGSDSAIIIIKQQEADLNIVGGTYEYDEQDHIADVIVTDKNGNEIHDAAVTVISGTVNVEGGTNVTTNDLYGTVNIDFPEGLTVPVAPNELPMRIEDAWNYYREKILEKQDAEKIVPSDVIAFLTWCGDKASEEAKNAFAEFEKMATDETVKAALDKINGVQSYVDVSSGTLIQKAERLQDMMMGLKGRYDYLIKQLKPLEKLDDNISITFYDLEKDADKLDYHRTGAYLYVGAITDPDYTIGAGKALVIIHSDDEYLMHDTHVPYDGKEHDIFIEDTTGRGDVQFIVYGENDGVIAIDKITKEVHLQIEDELSDLVCEFLNASGIFSQTITGESDVYLGTVYTKTENKVDQWTEKLTDKIIAKVKEKAKAKLVGDYAWADSAIDKVEEKVTAYLDTKYEDLKDTLLAKLNEIEQLDEGTRLYVNGFIPADLGTYEVTYFDFNVNEINMLLDNDVIQAVKAACEELGYHIELKDGSDTYVITAYEKADDAIVKFAQANVDDIIDDIFDYVVDNLEKYIDTKQDEYDTSEKVEAALEALKARIPAWKTKLLNSIQKVDGLDNYTRIVINGKKPVDVGTYNFFGFDFDMAATRGKLVIEPIYIEVTANNAQKDYGTVYSDPLTATVKYYSYVTDPDTYETAFIELTNLDPAIISDAQLSYDVNCEAAADINAAVGDYDIVIKDFGIADSENYVAMNPANGVFKVNPKEIIIEAVAEPAEIFVGESATLTTAVMDTDGNPVDVEVAYVINDDPTLTWQTTIATVGEYVITPVLAEDTGNYVVKEVKQATLIVKDKEVVIPILKTVVTVNPSRVVVGTLTAADIDLNVTFSDNLGSNPEKLKLDYFDRYEIQQNGYAIGDVNNDGKVDLDDALANVGTYYIVPIYKGNPEKTYADDEITSGVLQVVSPSANTISIWVSVSHGEFVAGTVSDPETYVAPILHVEVNGSTLDTNDPLYLQLEPSYKLVDSFGNEVTLDTIKDVPGTYTFVVNYNEIEGYDVFATNRGLSVLEKQLTVSATIMRNGSVAGRVAVGTNADEYDVVLSAVDNIGGDSTELLEKYVDGYVILDANGNEVTLQNALNTIGTYTVKPIVKGDPVAVYGTEAKILSSVLVVSLKVVEVKPVVYYNSVVYDRAEIALNHKATITTGYVIAPASFWSDDCDAAEQALLKNSIEATVSWTPEIELEDILTKKGIYIFKASGATTLDENVYQVVWGTRNLNVVQIGAQSRIRPKQDSTIFTTVDETTYKLLPNCDPQTILDNLVLSATDDHGYVADNSLSIGLEVTSLDPSAPVLFAMRNTDVLSELSKLSVPGTYLIKTKTIDAEGIYSSIIEDAITVIVEENGISDGEISWASWALELVGEVHNYFSFTVSGFDGLYESIDADGNVADIGLLVYNTKLENSSDCTIENADIVISGGTYDYEAGVYRLRSQGIPAKNMGDDAWYKIYVKTKDGYVYSQRLRFSPLVYCIDSVYGKNSNITNDELKAACVALMNYGAAAQEYFAVYNGYEYTELMNSSFDQYQHYVREFDDSMITDRIDWNREDFTIAPISTEISVTDISLTLEGEITYNMKFAANTNADKVGMLVWTQEQYRNGETSAEDALVVYANPEDISADAFYVGYTGIVARTMGDTFFTAAFVEEDGVFTYSKVNRCSVDHAAQLILRKDTIPEYKALAKTLVAYGDYAQEYFAKK